MRTAGIIMSILMVAACRNGQKEVKITTEVKHQETDSTYIFNGRNLDGWEITNFGPQGPVYVSGNEIILGMGDGCTGVTYTDYFPRQNYRVTLDAKRMTGNDFFCGMTFPVGKDPCTLIVGGWGGALVGLSSINGYDASENETTTSMRFETGRWYHIALEVREESIKAFIDDSLVVDFARNGKKLSIRPEVEMSRPFGIASWTTTAALRNIRLVEMPE